MSASWPTMRDEAGGKPQELIHGPEGRQLAAACGRSDDPDDDVRQDDQRECDGREQAAVAPQDLPRLVPGLRNRQFVATCSPFAVARALCGARAAACNACSGAAAAPSRGRARRTTTSNGASATASCPTRRRSPSWRSALPRSAPATARECVWLLEHPPLFTAGTSADPAELFNPSGFPVYEAGRGGRYTYHGPGQRVGYLMLDLERRGRDVRRLVHSLEGWIIATLGELGVSRASRRRTHRHLGRRRRDRSENRGARHPHKALGHAARLLDQRVARPFAFRRHRSVRHQRIRRHQPSSAWERNADDAR